MREGQRLGSHWTILPHVAPPGQLGPLPQGTQAGQVGQGREGGGSWTMDTLSSIQLGAHPKLQHARQPSLFPLTFPKAFCET